MSNAGQAVLNRLHPISHRFVWLGLAACGIEGPVLKVEI